MDEKTVIAEKILATLESQRFADWYNVGRFDAYITGDIPPVSRDSIIEEIKNLFHL